jgi:hypothetical protein
MQDIKRKFNENYLVGCIEYKGVLNVYLMPIAYWILNHEKYDPEYDPSKSKSVFRDNILNVTDDRIEGFYKSVAKYLLNLDDETKWEIKSVLPEYKRIQFYIDLDKKMFISGFVDIEVEDYLPDSNWSGELGFPSEYAPIEIKSVFE